MTTKPLKSGDSSRSGSQAHAPSVAAGPRPNPARCGPILLAIHGEEPTSAAMITAQRLAEQNELGLRVVTVVEFVHQFSGAPGLPPTDPVPPAAFTYPQTEAVRRRLAEALGATAKWSLDIRFGSPAREIARAAQEVDATFVVVDSAPRHGVRHVVSGARALQIVGRSPCPVLSVAPSYAFPPSTIVAAIDFSPPSIRAAQAALLFAGDRTRMILVHAPLPIHLLQVARDTAGALFGGDPAEYLARARAELDPFVPPGATIETRVIEGSVVRGVLALAESEQADLIAVGTHGPGAVERFFVGSVAAGLLHNVARPVLVAPPPEPAEFVRLELAMSGAALEPAV